MHAGTSQAKGSLSLVQRLQQLNHDHTQGSFPGAVEPDEEHANQFRMEYMRAHDNIDTSKLREATFEDIGVPQQAAW